VSELEGRGAAWTEERGTSDEGRRRHQAARKLAGNTVGRRRLKAPRKLAGGGVLEVTGLTVTFGQRGGARLTAVDDLSFSLRAGQTLALVGESGSGKSTVVRAAAQLLRPSSGQIRLDGRPAGRRGRALRSYRHKVQVIFQDPFASLNPMHTVHHHLARPLLLRSGRLHGDALDQAVHDLLQSVNLTPPQEVAAKYPHELSGGQRQRVAIARALATDPDVLLADEPVSMLDVSIRLEILNLLERLKRDRNLALLYVTHDLATARYFSSEIMVMYRGVVVERGPSDEVILNPAHPYTQILASAAPDPTVSRQALAAARRQRQDARAARDAEARENALSQGCRFRSRCPRAMPACADAPPSVQTGPDHHALCWLYAGQAGEDPRASAAAGGTEI
jgi:peptide/nickel transport system ATP-binding protein